MKTLVSALVALSVLTGVAASANALDAKRFYEQMDREGELAHATRIAAAKAAAIRPLPRNGKSQDERWTAMKALFGAAVFGLVAVPPMPACDALAGSYRGPAPDDRRDRRF